MKSMVSNRTKTEMGRISISLGELEALTIAENMRNKGLDNSLFYKHIERCINKLNSFKSYNSELIKEHELVGCCNDCNNGYCDCSKQACNFTRCKICGIDDSTKEGEIELDNECKGNI